MEKTSSQHLWEVVASLEQDSQEAMWSLLMELLGKSKESKAGLPSFRLTYDKPKGKVTVEWLLEPTGTAGMLLSKLNPISEGI